MTLKLINRSTDEDCYGHYEKFNIICKQCAWSDKCKNTRKMLESDNPLDTAIDEMEKQSGPELCDD